MVPESVEIFHEYMAEKYVDDPSNPMVAYPWSSVCIGGVLILLIIIDRLAVEKASLNQHTSTTCDPHAHNHSSQAFQQMISLEKNSTDKDIDVVNNKSLDTTIVVSTATIKNNSEINIVSSNSLMEENSDNNSVPVVVGKKDGMVRAYFFFIALTLHSVLDGLALGSESEDIDSLYSIIAAVVGHKVFDGLALGIPVYLANFNSLHKWCILIICALSTPIGIGIGMGAAELSEERHLVEAIIISLSAGSFLFISLMELLPTSLHDGKNIKSKLFAFFLGWVVMLALAANVDAHPDH